MKLKGDGYGILLIKALNKINKLNNMITSLICFNYKKAVLNKREVPFRDITAKITFNRLNSMGTDNINYPK